MTDSLIFGRAIVANPFDSNRPAEEFSKTALLTSLVILFVLIFSNLGPGHQNNMLVAVALDMLIIPPLLYFTQWLKAYLFEIGEWYQKVVFGLFGASMLIHLFKVVLA